MTISATTAAARAEAYRLAASNVQEMITTHGADFTPDMLLVFLTTGAERYDAFAAMLRATHPTSTDADYATLRRIVAAWISETNTSAGPDTADLLTRLQDAGIALDAEVAAASEPSADQRQGDGR